MKIIKRTQCIIIIIIFFLLSCEDKNGGKVESLSDKNDRTQTKEEFEVFLNTKNRPQVERSTDSVNPEFKTYSVEEMELYLAKYGTVFASMHTLGDNGNSYCFNLNDGRFFFVITKWGYIERWMIFDEIPEELIPKKGRGVLLRKLLLNESKGVDWEKAKANWDKIKAEWLKKRADWLEKNGVTDK